MLIPQAASPTEASSETPQEQGSVAEGLGTLAETAALPLLAVPRRLDPTSRYLICDRGKLVAAWEGNGQGWMLKTNAGLISALRNRDQIPNQGDFKLVELKLAPSESGLHLAGVTSYQLAERWALVNLIRGDDKILSAITGPGRLNRDQKNVVRQVIKDQLMYEVWKDAHAVLDYLANTDYHSAGV